MNGWLIHAGTLGYFLVPSAQSQPAQRAVKQFPAWSCSSGLSNQRCQRLTWRLWSLRFCLVLIKSSPREGVLPALPSSVWARLCRDRDRGYKKEQRHAKTISLRFQQPHLASLPPSTSIQRCTVISKSSPSCPGGPSCAHHSFLPWASLVCAGATAPSQGWKQDLSIGRLEVCRKEQPQAAESSLQHKQPRWLISSSTFYFDINSN